MSDCYSYLPVVCFFFFCFVFFFQAEDGIRYDLVTGVQTCALPISYFPKDNMIKTYFNLNLEGEVCFVIEEKITLDSNPTTLNFVKDSYGVDRANNKLVPFSNVKGFYS